VDEKTLLGSAGITSHVKKTMERKRVERIEKGSDHSCFGKSKLF